jgi:D-alanyl-D-alanine carboxypeptidase
MKKKLKKSISARRIAFTSVIFISLNLLALVTFANAQTSTTSLVATDIASTTASTTSLSLATTTATSTKIAATSSIMLSGKASWYSYQGGLFAASPDFPLGTLLRVISINNPTKNIIVTVNDHGPDRLVHPDRVIDLDKVAFAQLAPLGAGVIAVRIEIATSSVKSSSTNFLAQSIQPTAVVKKVTQTNNALRLQSVSGIVISAKTGKTLWSKNPNEKLPLASLSKIVAVKVFLDTKPKLSKVVTYKKKDEQLTYLWAGKGEIARLHVKDGETMTVNDLLYSALLGSANNAVESLVRVSGLTRTQFISRMNKYARSLGATQSYFVEPTGLSPQNVSSVRDYALMSKNALANKTIAKITSTKSYNFKTINSGNPHLINNTNKLMTSTNLKITGSKTGYLEEANYCLMTRAKSTKGEVIAVTFGTPGKAASFSETKQLVLYGLSHLN